MSTPTRPGAGPAGAPGGVFGGPSGSGPEGQSREAVRTLGPGSAWRGRVAGAVTILAVLALLLWVTVEFARPAGLPTDPASSKGDGSAALATLLRDRMGVAVDSVERIDRLPDRVPDDTTLLVTNGADVSTDQAARLHGLLSSSSRTVLVEPSQALLDATGAGSSHIYADGTVDGGQEAGCTTTDIDPSDVLDVDAMTRYDGEGLDPKGTCFGGFEGTGGGVVQVTGSRELVVVGASQALTNDRLDRGANAAVLLRLLSHRSTVLWYTVDPGDVSLASLGEDGGDGGTDGGVQVFPAWLGPAVVLLLAVVAAAMLWRGRRLGPLVAEPLPAVVHASESTRSLGRLYRRARDPGAAAATLRRASSRRLAEVLHLRPDDPALAEQVAFASGRSADEIRRLLDPAPDSRFDTAELETIAAQLTRLEEEVRRG